MKGVDDVICLHMETPFLVPFRYNRKKWDLIEVFREVIVGEVCTQRTMPLLLPHPALLKIWPCSPGALENDEENTEAELLRVYISRMESR